MAPAVIALSILIGAVPGLAAAQTATATGAVNVPPAGQRDRARVLLLFDEDKTLPGLAAMDLALRTTLSAGLEGNVEYFSESMNAAQFPEESHDQALTAYYVKKYGGRKLDLIIGVMGPAVNFLLRHADAFAPGVPVVFCGADHVEDATLPVRMTGTTVRRVFGPTLDLALRLQPETQHVFVVGGTSGFDRQLQAAARREFEPFTQRVPFTYLTDLSMNDLLLAVSGLPPRSVILYLSLFRDGAGRTFTPHDAAQRISAAARTPVYVFVDQYVGLGPVGGYVYSVDLHGRAAAEIGLRVLHGESPANIPVRNVPDNKYMVDARQLDRWRLESRLLPADTVIEFREPDIWAQYQWYVIAALGVTLVQTVLIAGLVVQRTRRRRVELALRESERHFHVMADTAPIMIWRSATDAACDFFNKPWLDFRGRTMEQEKGSGWIEGIHADDRTACTDDYLKAFEAREPFRLEYRLQRADGEYRWVLDIGVPRYDDAGGFAGYIGSAIDITDRKRVEEQNQDLAGRLISVQEEERTRIARDLHDDVSQQLAGLSILLSTLRRVAGRRGAEPDVDGTILTIQTRTSALADTVRNLSHELHPSVLEHAGLVETLRRHCADVEKHYLLKVIFRAADRLDSLRPEVALGLFRVAQEALTNVVRHARARSVQVQLTATDEGIELRVVDDGIGFVSSERVGSGLGLRSIDERVRLIRGIVCVDSHPGRGTTLLVRIPQTAASAEIAS
jgi:PAS domain S-box-containing protein